ncbi:LysR substrate-binding domain-containing protein [Microvirga pudoricolor]|uniref:LysR substrate-binding domain-containing protein n=1 Tax=Microvirga pudoricolor TaxID=2778729 RepID=UPI00195250F8|nr:LysR substrate-binding domain-containing protein [Microvirga pudoricolor]MBM6596288.1 LysR family transcriptional regulator [Microvirga pudoricolor]
MVRVLPPLNALRAFEASARLSSMSRAAAELHVTQAAVSKQIRTLEEALNLRLFARLPRLIQLTEDGERYFQVVTRVLDQLENGTRELSSPASRPVVRFSGYYGFNMHWLLPKLAEFKAQHPRIEVQLITTSSESVDFRRNEFDCAFRTGHGEWSDCNAELIAPIKFRPACSPTIKAKIQRPRDLLNQTLILSRGSPNVWKKWLDLVGLTDADAKSVLELDNAALAYQAAVQGVGIAIVDCLVVKDHVESGRLIYPFPQVYSDPRSYYFLWREQAKSASLIIFREWLFKSVEKDLYQVEQLHRSL